jgi:hypothetical protein
MTPVEDMSPESPPSSLGIIPSTLQIRLNLCVKRVKRAGHGFASFEHYRLRVLLHAGGVMWPSRPKPPRIRLRSPHSDA